MLVNLTEKMMAVEDKFDQRGLSFKLREKGTSIIHEGQPCQIKLLRQVKHGLLNSFRFRIDKT